MTARQLLPESSQGLMILNIFSWTCWQFFYFLSSLEKHKQACVFFMLVHFIGLCTH